MAELLSVRHKVVYCNALFLHTSQQCQVILSLDLLAHLGEHTNVNPRIESKY